MIPAYNEELRLSLMLKDTSKCLEKFIRKGSKQLLTYEMIVVDDGSKDNTYEVARSLQDKIPHLRVLKLSRNCGKGGAVKCGITVSRGQYILMADADAATDINDLGKLLIKLSGIEITSNAGTRVKRWGMVVGSRAHLEQASIATRELHRTILMMGFHALVSLLITTKVQDTQCGFKLFTRATAGLLFSNLHLERWAFDVEIIYLAERLGIPIAEVSVSWHEVAGSKLITSKWDVVTTSVSMAKDMVTVKCAYMLGLWISPEKPKF